jgi:acyl carrier protein
MRHRTALSNPAARGWRMDMSRFDSVLKKLTPLMQDCFNDDDVVAAPELTAAEVPGWDSLAHVRLMLMIERAFAIRLSATEISSFKNVGDLATAIAAKTPAIV